MTPQPTISPLGRIIARRPADPVARFLAVLAIAAALLFRPVLLEAEVPQQATIVQKAHAIDADDHRWKVSEASFYGPGFYGNTTACGQRMTPSLKGVAHKTLACGTLVRFEWHGRELVVPVVDRGPYTAGREWDLTAGACSYLDRCFTAAIAWTL